MRVNFVECKEKLILVSFFYLSTYHYCCKITHYIVQSSEVGGSYSAVGTTLVYDGKGLGFETPAVQTILKSDFSDISAL